MLDSMISGIYSMLKGYRTLSLPERCDGTLKTPQAGLWASGLGVLGSGP